MKKPAKVMCLICGKKPVGKTAGTWPELFGWEAGEFMTAWGIATYIDNMAAAGGKELRYPDVHPRMADGTRLVGPIPGEAYPSGGAVTKVAGYLNKWFTPHVDMISPDAHVADYKGIMKRFCAAYTREDYHFYAETGSRRQRACLEICSVR